MRDGGEVILFPKAKDEAVRPDVDVKQKKWSDCQHNVQLVLDQQAHQLICPACKQVLDPFDWITKYIQSWAYQNTRYRQAVQQAQEAEKRLVKLKRAETNAKARIRKQGVLLTSVQARQIKDILSRVGMVLRYARSHGSEGAADWIDKVGVSPEQVSESFKLLYGMLELEDTDEPAA